MEALWSDAALEDLEQIQRHISKDSPMYAERQLVRIFGRTSEIEEYPNAGRVVPEIGFEQIREVFEGSYRIMYQIEDTHILILRVIHFARNYRP